MELTESDGMTESEETNDSDSGAMGVIVENIGAGKESSIEDAGTWQLEVEAEF